MLVRLCVRCCFFFQAEDGIRDLVRSRGLGDVYKRQSARLVADLSDRIAALDRGVAVRVPTGINEPGAGLGVVEAWRGTLAVSYTHLTLPTSDLV